MKKHIPVDPVTKEPLLTEETLDMKRQEDDGPRKGIPRMYQKGKPNPAEWATNYVILLVGVIMWCCTIKGCW